MMIGDRKIPPQRNDLNEIFFENDLNSQIWLQLKLASFLEQSREESMFSN